MHRLSARHRRVPDCVKLTADVVRNLSWLPVTCAYRLVAKGQDLYSWHPLVSGSPDSVSGWRLGAGPGVGQRSDIRRTLAGPDRQMAKPQAARPGLRSDLRRRPQKTFGEEIVVRPDAGQDEEISSAHRLDVLLELFAVEARLHGEKARGEIGLETDEQKAHVELASVGHPPRKL